MRILEYSRNEAAKNVSHKDDKLRATKRKEMWMISLSQIGDCKVDSVTLLTRLG